MSKSKLKALNGEVAAAVILCVAFLGNLAFAQEDYAYDAKGRRNPFIPLVGPDARLVQLDKEESTHADLNVEGIIFDKQGRCFAIVNGSVVGIGDSVDTYQILKIDEKKVTFIKEDILRVVEIKKEGE